MLLIMLNGFNFSNEKPLLNSTWGSRGGTKNEPLLPFIHSFDAVHSLSSPIAAIGATNATDATF